MLPASMEREEGCRRNPSDDDACGTPFPVPAVVLVLLSVLVVKQVMVMCRPERLTYGILKSWCEVSFPIISVEISVLGLELATLPGLYESRK